jgi:hypothetical protein
VTVSPELYEYAETPDRYSVVASEIVSRYADDRVCIIQGPTWAAVSGVRTDDVEPLLDEVRERVPAGKDPAWWIGPSAQPPDLYERLEEFGLREPRDRASILHALVATQPPPEAPDDVEVHRVESFEDFAAAAEVRWEAFETPPERRERERVHLREYFDDELRTGVPVTFVAVLDGRPAATAMAIPSARGVFLIGGCTAPWARGRGLYRALVRARWDDAVDRGTPALVTHAKPDTSLPILSRLGFVEVCRIRRLEDVR